MIHVQPHVVFADKTTGLCPSFLSEAEPRDAVFKWCRKKWSGWFRLEQLTDYFHGSALWQAVWPMTDRVYRFVVTKNAQVR